LNRREEWHRRARDDIQAIARHDIFTARRIAEAVVRYVEDERGDVRKLVGQGGLCRLRVGDWRVLFTLEDEGQTVLVHRVLNRRDAYR